MINEELRDFEYELECKNSLMIDLMQELQVSPILDHCYRLVSEYEALIQNK